MALPFFYIESLNNQSHVVLDEDTSKHITQVLRMKVDEKLLLTNGKGIKAEAVIINDHRKRCEVRITETKALPPPEIKVTIGISIIKNASRFEWFLEKTTEIGVSEIIPLLCSRTEKEKFRHDRMQHIMLSAMLQSQQCWLPLLHQPTEVEKVIKELNFSNRFIAHCLPENKQTLTKISGSAIVLIGPEGDFTPEEITMALQNNYQAVTLGVNRLRTETAGLVAATLLCYQ